MIKSNVWYKFRDIFSSLEDIESSYLKYRSTKERFLNAIFQGLGVHQVEYDGGIFELEFEPIVFSARNPTSKYEKHFLLENPQFDQMDMVAKKQSGKAAFASTMFCSPSFILYPFSKALSIDGVERMPDSGEILGYPKLLLKDPNTVIESYPLLNDFYEEVGKYAISYDEWRDVETGKYAEVCLPIDVQKIGTLELMLQKRL